MNGKPTCANEGLLTTILRDTWKWDGFVVSDYDVRSPFSSRALIPLLGHAFAPRLISRCLRRRVQGRVALFSQAFASVLARGGMWRPAECFGAHCIMLSFAEYLWPVCCQACVYAYTHTYGRVRRIHISSDQVVAPPGMKFLSTCAHAPSLKTATRG